MSDTPNIEQRLREFAAARGGGADWDDVLRRAGGRFSVQRFPRRRLALALAAAVLVAAGSGGILFVASGARLAMKGPSAWAAIGVAGPTGAFGVTAAANRVGPTASTGPTGSPGLAAWPGPTGAQGPTGHFGPTGAVAPIRPMFLTAAGLEAVSDHLAMPIYWAGPRGGHRYELLRNRFDDVYVRYLPEANDRQGEFPIVATYPVYRAFDVLKKQADGKEIAGPEGSIILEGKSPATSVYLAFPNVDYEIEIYDRSPAVARAIAESGGVHLVR